MKIQFTGWERRVLTHQHRVVPVVPGNGYISVFEELQDVRWSEPNTFYGKVSGLALNGSFMMKCEFSDLELLGWLSAYSKENPKKALKLIAKAQAIAIQERDARKPKNGNTA